MKQAIMIKPKEIEFKEVPVPDITQRQVLVKIIRIGIWVVV